MKNKKSLILLASFIFFSAFGLQSCGQDNTPPPPEPVTLQFWSVFDDSSVYEPIINQYRQLNPHVTIEYRKLTINEYETTVLNALAAGKGPDIWSIHNTWLPKHQDKLAPAPESLLSLQAYEDTFVTVAKDDFVRLTPGINPETGLQETQSNIYAVPLAVDTLALYYNEDLLNSASIVDPPATWTELMRAVRQITIKNEFDDITLSGVSMGTASNVNRAPDLLSLLMLQNDTEMTNEEGTQALFNRSKIDGQTGEEFFPGLDALRFYTQFSDPRKEVYTWTPTKDNSIDAFASESSAMMINFSYQRENLFAKAPKLSYKVAPVPQIEGTSKEVNYANYWGQSVSATSANQEEAWKFLVFLAGNEQSTSYLSTTGRPAARKDIIKQQLEDPFMGIFAAQALTAKTWTQTDSAAIDGIFNQMIDSVALGEQEDEEALNTAAQQVTAILNK
jgi:ABC-type glycerol-3-phosphate transport system substrate-binding protein